MTLSTQGVAFVLVRRSDPTRASIADQDRSHAVDTLEVFVGRQHQSSRAGRRCSDPDIVRRNRRAGSAQLHVTTGLARNSPNSRSFCAVRPPRRKPVRSSPRATDGIPIHSGRSTRSTTVSSPRLCHRPRRGRDALALARCGERILALRAVESVDVSSGGSAPRPFSPPLLYLCGWAGGYLRRNRAASREPTHRDPQPPAASGIVVQPGRSRRQWGSHLLGPPPVERPAHGGAQPQRRELELRFRRVRLRHEQRGGAHVGRGTSDRSRLRYGLPIDAGLLPTRRSRPLGERRCGRVPHSMVSAPARPRDAAALLPGVSTRGEPAHGPAVVVVE